MGRSNPVHNSDALLHRIPLPISYCRSHGHHALGCTMELAAPQLLLCHRAFSLRPCGRNRLLHLCWNLLLVPQGYREVDERNSGEMAFLALRHWFPYHIRHYALSRSSWYAAVDLHLSTRPRMELAEFCRFGWRSD